MGKWANAQMPTTKRLESFRYVKTCGTIRLDLHLHVFENCTSGLFFCGKYLGMSWHWPKNQKIDQEDSSIAC